MARDNDIFKFKRSPKKDEALPEQAALILKLIHDATGGQITRGDLIKKLETQLTTRQTPARVLSFYRGPLVSTGLVTIISAEPAEKPKAAKKAKAAKPVKKVKAAKAKTAKAKPTKGPKPDAGEDAEAEQHADAAE